MRYLSVCSGIEAATVAWHPLGWKPAAFSEIEAFPCAVLKHHYPDVPNLGDMTKYKEWNLGAIDILVGGTPCQSFSVAGLRKGLEDPRGNLALVYCGILDRFRPKWFVWENVPGVLSSSDGRDFGSFLGAVAELGYGFAYRVLDAQYFGVAQRRRRVFVVGYLGDWRPAAKVLFESESVRRDSPPSREAGQTVAPTVVQGPPYSRTGNERVECDAIVAFDRQSSGEYGTAKVASTVAARDYKSASDLVTQPVVGALDCRIGVQRAQNAQAGHLLAHPIAYAIQGSMIGRNDNAGPQCDEINEEVCFTQNTTDRHAVAHPMVLMDQGGSVMNVMNDGTVGTLRRETKGHEPSIIQDMAVRRLTPVECERLQGFPDHYTDIKPKGKETPDGPRYKALGNSMAVPVMGWIGKRIAELS
jgi:DNA (cytosine-5)-methyltransferase 1